MLRVMKCFGCLGFGPQYDTCVLGWNISNETGGAITTDETYCKHCTSIMLDIVVGTVFEGKAIEVPGRQCKPSGHQGVACCSLNCWTYASSWVYILGCKIGSSEANLTERAPAGGPFADRKNGSKPSTYRDKLSSQGKM